MKQVRRVKQELRPLRRATRGVAATPRSGSLAQRSQLGASVRLANGRTASEQATKLGHPHLLRAQREGLLARIGRTQGNQHAQHVVASLSRNKGAGPSRMRPQPIAQRQPIKGDIAPTGKAPAGTGATKIFGLKGPGLIDAHVKSMMAYFENTLGHKATLVDDVPKLLDQLLALGRKGIRVSRLIIAAHGTKGGAVKGGTLLQPHVSPQSLLNDPKAAKVRKHVMAKGAVVEFWACNIGKSKSALKKWAKVFGAEARATPGKMAAETNRFTRYALDYAEYSAKLKRSRTHNAKVIIESTSEVYNIAKPKNPMPYWKTGFGAKKGKLVRQFNASLVKLYDKLAKTREILETKPPRTRSQKLDYMRKLFDRSKGVIRSIFIKKGRAKIRPERKPAKKWRAWLKMWKRERFSP